MTALNFALLTPELIDTIANELNATDTRNLRLVNRGLATALQKALLRSIVLSVHPDGAQRHMARLKDMFIALQNGHGASTTTRRLVLDVESVTPYELWGEDDVGKEPLAMEDELKMLMPFIIRSFKGVTELRWNYYETDLDWTNDAITEALRPLLPRLQVVDIAHLVQEHVPLLKGLSKLKKFATTIDADPWLNMSLEPLERVIERSALTLQLLDLTSSAGSDIHIEEFLQFSSPALKGLPSLHTLKLAWGIEALTLTPTSDIPYTILPSLQSLTLRLSTLDYDEPLDEEGGDETCDIWTFLRDSGVRLKHLDISGTPPISQSMLDYLSSYSNTLEDFSICWRQNDVDDDGNEQFDPLATQLLSTALVRHRYSLLHFQIGSETAGECARWHYLACIQDFLKNRYPQLQELTIKNFSVHGQVEGVFPKALIDAVMRYNPQILKVDINCGSDGELDEEGTEVEDAIKAYRWTPVESAHVAPPVLSTEIGLWNPVALPEGWKYTKP